MRSLSLESIPANKNMKLLGLLVTLLALSYANSDKLVAKTLCELLNRLKCLETHEFKPLNKSVQIQTPREINNACECEALFAEHLERFLRSVKSEVPKSLYGNILDNAQKLQKTVVKNESNVSCIFTTHNLTKITSDDMKPLIQDNIKFIQNWNANCKPNNYSCKSKKYCI